MAAVPSNSRSERVRSMKSLLIAFAIVSRFLRARLPVRGGPQLSYPLSSRKWSAKILLLYAALVPVLSTFGQVGADGQEITVRFVDYRSGSRIKKLDVMVEGFNGELTGRSADRTTVFSTSTKTDNEGKLIIRLPRLPPQQISIFSFDLAESTVAFSLADVLKSGVVALYRKGEGHSKLNVATKPREIVILNRKLTVWDKMRQEIP